MKVTTEYYLPGISKVPDARHFGSTTLGVVGVVGHIRVEDGLLLPSEAVPL